MKKYFTIRADANSPVLVHVPHGATLIPASEKQFFIPQGAALEAENELLFDLGVKQVGQQVKNATVFANDVSRLVCDPERFYDDDMEKVGMGLAYTKTHDGKELRSEEHKERIFSTYFEPYHQAFTETVDNILEQHGHCVILDVHSYSVKRLAFEQGGVERPEICLGTDPYHTPSWLVGLFQEIFSAYEIKINTPYAGTIVPLDHYTKTREVSSIMLEMRKDMLTEHHDDIVKLINIFIARIREEI